MVNETLSSESFIEGRGTKYCRGCLGENLFSGLDLGELPIANELLKSADGNLDTYPLHLKVCAGCGLGQVADVVTPERIFRDYRYLSSMSSTFLQHAAEFVNQRIEEEVFASSDWVLEIASNDGYLLKNFIPFGVTAIGIEPAENVAQVSKNLGIHTISEFFSSRLAKDLLAKHGYPKLIIANNVLAHVPDLIDFVKGLSVLCGAETRISIENPSLANILVGMQFDTIYHEHYSYLSATSMQNISNRHGLHLFKVEELAIHGGSNRYWLQIQNGRYPTDLSVKRIADFELEIHLFDSAEWDACATKVNGILEQFRNWLHTRRMEGNRVHGYGAAAKASTILNSIKIEPNSIISIADVSLEKQSRFMPPHGIKIVSPEELFEQNPTDIVIFPWNIKTEIVAFLQAHLGEQVRFWCAIPEMCRVYN